MTNAIEIFAERSCGVNYTLSHTLHILLDRNFKSVYHNVILLKSRRRRRFLYFIYLIAFLIRKTRRL